VQAEHLVDFLGRQRASGCRHSTQHLGVEFDLLERHYVMEPEVYVVSHVRTSRAGSRPDLVTPP